MSEEFARFITVYNETRKIVVLSEFKDLHGRVKINQVFQKDMDMEEYVDLDSPIQLMDRKSNKLYIKSEDEGNKENSNEKVSSRYDKFQNYIINLIFQTFAVLLQAETLQFSPTTRFSHF